MDSDIALCARDGSASQACRRLNLALKYASMNAESEVRKCLTTGVCDAMDNFAKYGETLDIYECARNGDESTACRRLEMRQRLARRS